MGRSCFKRMLLRRRLCRLRVGLVGRRLGGFDSGLDAFRGRCFGNRFGRGLCLRRRFERGLCGGRLDWRLYSNGGLCRWRVGGGLNRRLSDFGRRLNGRLGRRSGKRLDGRLSRRGSASESTSKSASASASAGVSASASESFPSSS